MYFTVFKVIIICNFYKTILFFIAPQNNVYNNLGQECVGAGCSVDLFIFNNSYVDIATIGQICRLTGGEIYKYTYFQVSYSTIKMYINIYQIY